MFLDLDRFKRIYDSHGHAAGDVVLKEVARRLLQYARDEDTVCRNGGDEFLYLLMDPGARPCEVTANVPSAQLGPSGPNEIFKVNCADFYVGDDPVPGSTIALLEVAGYKHRVTAKRRDVDRLRRSDGYRS
jgi:GGDEF domain-containing protein